MNLKTDSVTSGLDVVKRQSKAAMAEFRKEVTESNHSLAILGETIGVGIPRHIRGFISELPGVSSAMSAAFSGIAIVLVGKVLMEVAEKVKKVAEAYKAVGEAAKKSAEAWRNQLSSINASNDAMELFNAKLEAQIAKIEHKPVNNLKIAMLEAQEQTDKLAESIGKAIENEIKLLDTLKVGTMAKFLGNAEDNSAVAARNREAQEAINGKKDTRNDAVERLNAQGLDHNSKQYIESLAAINAALNKGLHDVAVHYAALFENDLKVEKGKHQAAIDEYNNPQMDGNGEYHAVVPTDDTRLQMDQRNAARFWKSQAAAVDLDNVHGSLQGKLTGAEGAHSAEEIAVKAVEKIVANFKSALAEHGVQMSPYDLQGIYKGARDQQKPGSDAWNALNAKYGEASSEVNKEELSTRAVWLKNENELLNEHIKLSEDDERGLKEQTEAAKGWIAALGEGRAEQAKATLANDEANVKYLEQTGQLSKNGAAMEEARIKAKAYADEIAELKTRLAEISAAGYLTPMEKNLRTQQTKNQIASLQGQMDTEGLKAKGDADSQSAMTGLHQFWTAAVNDANDAAAQVKSLMTRAVDSINDELVKGMMGKKMDWGKAFEGMASSTLHTGLKQGEGILASAFGLGGKAGDSATKPLYTWQVNAGLPGGAAGSGGGFLSGFLHMLHIPGYASGGTASGGLSFVGENGIELADLPSGTQVTNNRDLRDMLKGGGPTYHIGNIDARGTNAADVAMRVHQAMQQVHAQSVQSSIKAQREMAARRPRSS
jgi:hypothetical protein